MADHRRARSGTSGGYRIGVVLVAIALIPLLGTGWFTIGEVVEARSELDRVSAIEADVGELVALSELRTRLLDEQNWSSAEGGMEELGLSRDLVLDMTGIDVPREAAEAAGRVDALVEQRGLLEIGEQLAEVRADIDRPLVEVSAGYRELEDLVAQRAGYQLDKVIMAANDMSEPTTLVNSLRVLESATIARQSISAEFNHFFGAQFSDRADRPEELRLLLAYSALRHAALEEMERLAEPGSEADVALATIGNSRSARSFEVATTELVDSGLRGDQGDASLLDVLAELETVANAFEDSSVTTDLYLDLVGSAGDDVYAATARAGAAARASNQYALTLLIVLACISMVVAFAATRAIAQPIHHLAAAARRISSGETTLDPIAETGPIEVREATHALNEASAHLALAEQQALALAEGDLDHTSLSEASSGALGASLQSAVRRLASSLQDREELRHRMTHEATHDGLTRLPNRNASLAHLRHAVARRGRLGGQLAVLFVDLDGFKEVNDKYGHSAGDQLLQIVAERLAVSVGDDEHVGRLGGDEFVVIVEPVYDEHEALLLADAVKSAVSEPIDLDAAVVTVGASIGVALSAADDNDAGGLLHSADLALYQAKELGRNRVQICDDDLRSAMTKQASLEHELRRTVMDHEFVLHYQPIVAPKSDAIIGLEALIRWNRPGRGLVSPDEFIPVAERSDLIISIDRWVVEAVARQITAWEDDGVMGDLVISINISGHHLASPDFVASIVGPLNVHGVDPSRVIIEITESALLEDLGSAAAKLESLREHGIRIAIDDFGTGYTSLAHLKSLPIDILKIDRSFTSDDSDASLVQLIIDTGHLLGASITAEGIETAAQAIALDEMGSDDLQGYLYGPPLPASELRLPAPVVELA